VKVTKTGRGFEIVEFEDHNGQACSLQQSSAIGWFASDAPGSSFVWLGVNDVIPKVLVQNEGWVDVKLQEGAMTSARMHLDQDSVKSLVKHLNRWLKTGSLKARKPKKGAPK
jgi:hypothetical protein